MKYRKKKMRVLTAYDLDSGWLVVPVHYSHDPNKNEEWAEKARASYVRAESWQREMEIDFSDVGGIRAYPSFKKEAHVRTDLVYNDSLPLCLMVDFNVGFMVWEIGQVVNGVPQVIDEIVLSPGNIPNMVREFRVRYPFHAAGVYIYGDATGRARSTHDQQSNYDIILSEFKGYSSEIELRVPVQNPPVKMRLNAVNRILVGENGKIGIYISNKCEELIKDLEMVLLDKDGGILQRRRASDPYSQRTHASDALGYWISWEWPILGVTTENEIVNSDYKRPLRIQRYFGMM